MKNNLNVVLFEPLIPGNTGNIMRTCVGTNTNLHLIKPLGFSLDEKYLKRPALDYIKDLKYFVYENWDDFTSKNPGKYYFYTRYSKNNYSEVNYNTSENLYLIFGKETTGIDKNILKDNLDNTLRIPMSDKIRCLNLANSVAIALYEVLRQRNFPDLSLTEVQKGEDFLYKKDN